MTDQDTLPAGETAAGATPLSEALTSSDHRRTPDHQPHEEVGVAPSGGESPMTGADAQPAQAPGDTPAPAAPAAPAVPAPAAAMPAIPTKPDGSPDFDKIADDPAFKAWLEPKMPKWARDAIKAAQGRGRTAPQPSETAPPAAPAQPQPRPTIPNPAEDPEGYHRAITGHFGAQMADFALRTTLNLSERFARQQHGNDTFENTKAWLTSRPDLEEYFTQQPDPWGAAIEYLRREQLAQEIGDDPAAYRKRLEDEIRAQIAAENGGGQAMTGQPAPAPSATFPAPAGGNQAPRSAPPPAASTARTTSADRDPSTGRFTGGTPLSAALKNGSR